MGEGRKGSYLLIIAVLVTLLCATIPAVHSADNYICFGGCTPPVFCPIEKNWIIDENSSITFTVNATDPDNNPLTYSAAPLPQGATFDNTTGGFSWTPSYTQSGTYSINFTVTDTEGLSDIETINITVIDVNLPPILSPIGDQVVAENSTLSFIVNATDADGNTLAYSAYPLPQGATLSNWTGDFVWTPSYTQSGTYLVNLTVTDAGGLSDSETITINVTDVNVPPVLDFIGNRTVEEGTLLNFTVNATDQGNDTLTFSATPLPQRATFNTSTRLFSWIPSYTENGTYTVNFTVTDPSGLFDYENVTILVIEPIKSQSSATNHAPIFDPIFDPIGNQIITGTNAITGSETYAITFRISATDFDTDNLTYSAIQLPSDATFDSTSRIFSWTPRYGSIGSYWATFGVTDGSYNDQMSISITVAAQPLPLYDCV